MDFMLRFLLLPVLKLAAPVTAGNQNGYFWRGGLLVLGHGRTQEPFRFFLPPELICNEHHGDLLVTPRHGGLVVQRLQQLAGIETDQISRIEFQASSLPGFCSTVCSDDASTARTSDPSRQKLPVAYSPSGMESTITPSKNGITPVTTVLDGLANRCWIYQFC